MEENKKTNSEEVEAKETLVPEDADKLTDEELENAAGGIFGLTHSTIQIIARQA